MATLTAASYNEPALARPQAGPVTRSYNYSFTAALAASDEIKYFKLPKGAKLCGFGWAIENGGDYDTATNLTLSLQVTDGTTTKTVISGSTLAQGAAGRVTQDVGNGSLQVGWMDFKTTSDDFYVRILIAAGPSTSTSGTLRCTATYTLDTDPGQ